MPKGAERHMGQPESKKDISDIFEEKKKDVQPRVEGLEVGLGHSESCSSCLIL